jgi:hypothetical protein
MAALEIPAQLIVGSPDLVTKYLYRTGFVLAYIVPWFAFSRSRIQFWLSFVTCVVFLSSASKIASVGGNQQGYDVYFPLMLMLAILSTVRAARASTERSALLYGVAAGCCLTTMELLRPFGLFVLVVLVAYATLLLHRRRKLVLGAMLVPIVALSGAWHLKLFIVNGGQIVWSNHGGYNLYNGWQKHVPDTPPVDKLSLKELASLTHQDFVGSGTGNRMRIDSELHTMRSQAMGRAVTRFIVRHPVESLRHVHTGLARLFEPKIIVFSMYGGREIERLRPAALIPKGPEISVYPYFVWATTGWFGINLLLLALLMIRKRAMAVLRLPECATLLVGALITLLIVLGDRGEEARFLFVLLPLLAAYPSVLAWKCSTSECRSVRRAERMTGIGQARPAVSGA